MNYGRKKRPAPNQSEAEAHFQPRPGDYGIGSPQSRAAARALAEAKKKPAETIQIVYVSPDGKEENGPLIKTAPV